MPEENFEKQEEQEEEQGENSGKNPEEIKSEKKESIEKAFIPLPVTVILTLIALQSDGFEAIAPFMAAVDFGATWVIAWLDGIASSTAIFFYLTFKTVNDLSIGTNVGFLTKQIIKRRIAPAIAGFIADSFTGGILPIRTVTFLLIVFLNNHNCRKQLDKLEER